MSISAAKLEDFFKFYDKGNDSHVKSIEILHEELVTSAPRLLEDETAWIRQYRSPPLKEERAIDPSKVPYDCQLDNPGADGWRECFSSSCAMAAMYWGVIDHQNEYHNVRPRFGDSTDPSAQVRTLNHFGLNAVFKMMGSKQKLKDQLDRGRVAPVGFLHHGPVHAPSGGGHYVLAIAYHDEEECFEFHDPFGELNCTKGGYQKTGGTYGKNIKYSYKNWVPRWSVANPNDGWGMDIWK